MEVMSSPSRKPSNFIPTDIGDSMVEQVEFIKNRV
jgi:hypothetical protein